MTSGTDLPEIAVTVDSVVFTERGGRPVVALVERKSDPYRGMLAFPGGFVEEDEDLPAAAVRELAEETTLQLPVSSLTQLGAYGKPGRDPRMRVVSVVYWALVPELGDPTGGSDAASSLLVPVADALADGFELAFDHQLILADAWEAAQP